MTRLKSGVMSLAVTLLASQTMAHRALACASCGSGGEDPMILYPWENWKAYMGFSRTGEMESINEQGEVASEFAVTTRNTTTVSFGHSFSQRVFATATAPYIVNKRDQYQRSGWGDPLASVRYTAVQQTLASEWIPQVQLIAGYRSGGATSIYDYQDQARLDIRGTGIPEGRGGIDIWSGMNPWKGGMAQSVSVPLQDRKTDFGVVRNGVTYRSTATFGYGWGDSAKLIGGINREQTTQKSLDGQPLADSDMLSHTLFITADGRLERNSSVRLTYTRAGSVIANRNTNRNQAFTLALMRSF